MNILRLNTDDLRAVLVIASADICNMIEVTGTHI